GRAGEQPVDDWIGAVDDEAGREHVGRARAAGRALLGEVRLDPLGRVDEDLGRDAAEAALEALAARVAVEHVDVEVAGRGRIAAHDRAGRDDPDRLEAGEDEGDRGAERAGVWIGQGRVPTGWRR